LLVALLAALAGCGGGELLWRAGNEEERQQLRRLERRLDDAGFDARLANVNAYVISEGSIEPPAKATIPALIVRADGARVWVHRRGPRWDPVLGKGIVEIACGDGTVVIGRARPAVQAVGLLACG
jgi:hypothetical protein